MEEWLEGYDLCKKLELVQGFQCGFDVRYKGSLPRVQSHNLTSALTNPDVVDDKLQAELNLNRIVGPFVQRAFPTFRTSPIGLVEKKTPGKFRLIHHLSYPPGDSVNDGISPVDAHVQYESIDDAVRLVQRFGRGCYMAKTDIAEAFRIVPLHPSQYHIFAFFWRERYYYDRC